MNNINLAELADANERAANERAMAGDYAAAGLLGANVIALKTMIAQAAAASMPDVAPATEPPRGDK